MEDNPNNIDLHKYTWLQRHLMGATVLHEHPFGDLPSHFRVDIENESNVFWAKWIADYYLYITSDYPEDWVLQMRKLKRELNEEVLLELLGHINWRARSVGAYFAMVAEKPEMMDIICVHFIKSEVCIAARSFCVAIAYFNTPWGMFYLRRYLDHYLTKYQLYFDQLLAIQTLLYLDYINGTNYFKGYEERWEEFLIYQPDCKNKLNFQWIEKEVNMMRKINKRGVIMRFREWLFLS